MPQILVPLVSVGTQCGTLRRCEALEYRQPGGIGCGARLDRETVSYFKSMSEEIGIPYQSLINLYLRDCAIQYRKLKVDWCSE